MPHVKSEARIGQKHGRLTTLAFKGNFLNGQPAFLFRCDCGTEKVLNGGRVFCGMTKSCGCLKLEQDKKVKWVKHAMTGTRVHYTWMGMRARCLSKACKDFPRYGGRGIKICERWMDFSNFLADMGEPKEGESIDRIDVNGDYCFENCRWATATVQSRNKRNTVMLEWQGRRQCISVWAEEIGIPYTALAQRVVAGWPVEKIMTQAYQPKTYNRVEAAQ